MSTIFGKQLFQKTCCVTALLSCVCKVIQYAVLTMHILKIPLGFFKVSVYPKFDHFSKKMIFAFSDRSYCNLSFKKNSKKKNDSKQSY